MKNRNSFRQGRTIRVLFRCFVFLVAILSVLLISQIPALLKRVHTDYLTLPDHVASVDQIEQVTQNNDESVETQLPFAHIRQLVFAGGGGRGFAYFPAVKYAMESYGLDLHKIEATAGTSAGAMAALISSITTDINALEDIYFEMPSQDFADFSWSNLVFFSSRKWAL